MTEFASHVGRNRVPYPVAYGEKNIYQLVDIYQFIPYDSLQDENIRRKVHELAVFSDCYDFWYETKMVIELEFIR